MQWKTQTLFLASTILLSYFSISTIKKWFWTQLSEEQICNLIQNWKTKLFTLIEQQQQQQQKSEFILQIKTIEQEILKWLQTHNNNQFSVHNKTELILLLSICSSIVQNRMDKLQIMCCVIQDSKSHSIDMKTYYEVISKYFPSSYWIDCEKLIK